MKVVVTAASFDLHVLKQQQQQPPINGALFFCSGHFVQIGTDPNAIGIRTYT